MSFIKENEFGLKSEEEYYDRMYKICRYYYNIITICLKLYIVKWLGQNDDLMIVHTIIV